MRLHEVVIRNFKCITELSIAIPQTVPHRAGSADFLTILGRNNIGKSSVLEAIRLALPGSDISKPSIDHFREKNLENGPIEVEFEFTNLSEEDKQRQGIRTHVFNDRYRIKKVWTEPNKTHTVFAFHPQNVIRDLPDKATTWTAYDINEEWRSAVQSFAQNTGRAVTGRVTKDIQKELEQYILESVPSLVEESEARWQLNPGGIQQNVDAILPRLIFVPALKHTKEEAGVSEKSSTARQIVEAMFANELSTNQAVRKFSEAALEVRSIFTGEGEGRDIVRGLEERLSTKLNRLIPLSAKLDFVPPDFTTDLASKTVLELTDGIVNTKPEHQGHGAQRALVISLLELFAESNNQVAAEGTARNVLLLVEEPEIYLHPQMSRKMRDVLTEIARTGTAQVICTSHSPIFINVADRHDGICILRKDATNRLYSVQRTEDLFVGEGAEESRNRLRMLLDFDPTVLEAFFAERVCLVEGDCEVAAVEAIANKLIANGVLELNEYLLTRRDVTLINCRGKWTIRAFQRVLNGFGIPYIVVHDADREGETGANLQILLELQRDETRRLTHSPNFEEDIFNESWSNDKPWRATKKINAMTQIPETLMRFFQFVTGIRLTITTDVPEAAAATE